MPVLTIYGSASSSADGVNCSSIMCQDSDKSPRLTRTILEFISTRVSEKACGWVQKAQPFHPQSGLVTITPTNHDEPSWSVLRMRNFFSLSSRRLVDYQTRTPPSSWVTYERDLLTRQPHIPVDFPSSMCSMAASGSRAADFHGGNPEYSCSWTVWNSLAVSTCGWSIWWDLRDRPALR